jgi:hypothetical protein
MLPVNKGDARTWTTLMADWLPGVTKVVAGQSTGSFDSEANPTWKLGLHTTEGFSIGGAEAAYRNGGYWPHITVGVTDFDDWKFGVHQHFPFWSRSTTFADGSGGIRTNRDYVIQVEIVGTCDDSWKAKQGGKYKKLHVDHWPDDYARYVAGVLKEIMQHRPIPNRTTVTWTRYPASYGTRAKQRLSTAAYDAYSGILGHQHVPENCVHPDTLILAADMRWVRAGDLRTGDRLVGFDEENAQVGSTPGRRFREAFATVHGTVEKDCYQVKLADGAEVVASADHKWLVNLPYVNRGSRIAWVETRNLDPAKYKIKSLGVQPWTERLDKEAGWLAGAIDCDGAVVFNKAGDAGVLFGQSVGRADVLDRFVTGVRDAKLEHYEVHRDKPSGYGRSGFTDVRVKGGLWRLIGFLAELAPEKFEAVRDNCWINRVVGKTTTAADIASIEHVGRQPVVSLETSTRTYVAASLLCHNTHGDPGNLLPFLQKYVLPSAPKPPAPTPKPVPPVEEPMANPARLVQVKGQDAVYAVTLSGAVHIKNPTHLTHLRESGQVAWPPKEITAAALAQLLEKE